MQERGERNVFHDYYRALVQALYEQGVTSNVFCVNVDGGDRGLAAEAALAALPGGRARRPRRWRRAAFTIFLFARMAGSAAEIEDHLNRGRNMDTRTPASAVRFIA